MKKHFGFAALALLACACSPLTAEHPLFSSTDQIGPPPFTEGYWVMVGDQCPRAVALRRGRLSGDCQEFQLRRNADGSWRFFGDARDEKTRELKHFEVQFVVAPATEHPAPDAYAPLYVAEYLEPDDPDNPPDTPPSERPVRYAALAPIGTLPATELAGNFQIGCTEILRDGPIDGVNVQRETSNGQEVVRGCVAANQAAVREAARRAIIDGLANIDQQRLVYRRP